MSRFSQKDPRGSLMANRRAMKTSKFTISKDISCSSLTVSTGPTLTMNNITTNKLLKSKSNTNNTTVLGAMKWLGYAPGRWLDITCGGAVDSQWHDTAHTIYPKNTVFAVPIKLEGKVKIDKFGMIMSSYPFFGTYPIRRGAINIALYESHEGSPGELVGYATRYEQHAPYWGSLPKVPVVIEFGIGNGDNKHHGPVIATGNDSGLRNSKGYKVRYLDVDPGFYFLTFCHNGEWKFFPEQTCPENLKPLSDFFSMISAPAIATIGPSVGPQWLGMSGDISNNFFNSILGIPDLESWSSKFKDMFIYSPYCEYEYTMDSSESSSDSILNKFFMKNFWGGVWPVPTTSGLLDYKPKGYVQEFYKNPDLSEFGMTQGAEYRPPNNASEFLASEKCRENLMTESSIKSFTWNFPSTPLMSVFLGGENPDGDFHPIVNQGNNIAFNYHRIPRLFFHTYVEKPK